MDKTKLNAHLWAIMNAEYRRHTGTTT